MTSKERVLTALACQEPDRVPSDYSANPGIDRRLKDHFGLAPDDGVGLRVALGCDFRGVGAPYAGPPLHPQVEGRRVDREWGWHTRWVEHESGAYDDYCDFPLQGATEEMVEAWPMPNPDDYDYSGIETFCRDNETWGLYVGNPGLACIINTVGFLFGMEQTLIDMLEEAPPLQRFIDRMLGVQLEVARRTLEAAKGGIDFLWMGEDLGSQYAPLISLDMFRQQVRPRHQRFIDLAKTFGIPAMIHTCGSSSWSYEDYIEMGMKAVDTLQPEAADMSPSYLKEHFGGRLAFHGCISTAGPIAFGSIDDVVADCKQTLDIMMPGGGYCFSPTHDLQDNSPVENVLAAYEVARTYGRYR